MISRFHLEAKAEFDAAVDFYESRQPNLGTDFSKVVFDSIKMILEYPDSWTPVYGKYRRCLTRRFPYGIIYYKEGDTINIICNYATK
ncbi:MAG: type II toxin-antitoxin system RelE/ParE family toxin [Candidatus Sigynarchaeota archaeon]